MTAIFTGRILGLVLTCFFLLTTVAHGRQAPSSFARLADSVGPGSKITVRDAAGDEIQGTLTELSVTTVKLLSDGKPRSLPLNQVNEVWRHTRGPLANGAFWGMVIGAGIGGGLGVVAALDDGPILDFGGEAILIGIASGAGLGTATGVLIDVLWKENRLVYRAPGEQALFQPGLTGAKVSFRF